MRCSIIIPTLNEAKGISPFLAHLQKFRTAGHEVIVIDGGSTDSTCQLATPHVDQLLKTSSGRARQMNAGADVASGEVLVFLHADTFLPDTASQDIEQALTTTSKVWGRFDVRLSGQQILFRVIEWMMNRRSCITGLATGDQAMFVRRDVFDALGGFHPMPLMEDVEFSRRLCLVSHPFCIKEPVVTDSRRWQKYGAWRTIFLMWQLRWRYWRGESPESLAQIYRSDVRNASK